MKKAIIALFAIVSITAASAFAADKAEAPVPPADAPQDKSEDLPF